MEAAFVALIGTGQIGAERSRFQDGNPSVPVFDLDLDDAETLLNPLSAGLAEIAAGSIAMGLGGAYWEGARSSVTGVSHVGPMAMPRLRSSSLHVGSARSAARVELVGARNCL